MASTQFALPPAPAPTRPRVLMVATVFGVTAATVLFATLVGVCLTLRARGGGRAEWLRGGRLALVPANMAAITLLMSSVSIQWAITAMGRNDRKHAYLRPRPHVAVRPGVHQLRRVLRRPARHRRRRRAYGVVVYAMYGTHIVMIASTSCSSSPPPFALGGQYSPRRRGWLPLGCGVARDGRGYVLILSTVVWLK